MSALDKDGNEIPDDGATAQDGEGSQDFDAAWEAAGGEATSDDAGADGTGGGDSQPLDGDTPPREGSAGREAGGARGGGGESPSADADADGEGGAPDKDAAPDPLKDAPPWAQAFRDGMDKLNRDTRSAMGRLDARLNRMEQARQVAGGRGGGAGSEQRPASAPPKRAELSNDMKSRIEKVREVDPDAADAMEAVALDNAQIRLDIDARLQSASADQQAASQQMSDKQALDAAFPDDDWQSWLTFDQHGAFAHPEFAEFVNGLPYVDARTLLESDDVSDAIRIMRVFKDSQNGGGSPSQDAGPRGGGNEPDKSTTARQARRQAQRRSATGAQGPGGGAPNTAADPDSFDAGWNAVEREERRLRDQRLNILEDRRAQALH